MEHVTEQHRGRWYHADGRLDGHIWRPAYSLLPVQPHHAHEGLSLVVGGDSVIGDETFSTREQARNEAVAQAKLAIDGGA